MLNTKRYAVTVSTTGPAVTRDGMIISRHTTLDGAVHVACVLNGPDPRLSLPRP